jgi:predicted dehydrogenase
VKIAIVGTGFIAETRARAYARLTGYPVQLVAAVSRTRERAEAHAQRHSHHAARRSRQPAAMVDATRHAGVQLMYGENWVYAPSIAKADDWPPPRAAR